MKTPRITLAAVVLAVVVLTLPATSLLLPVPVFANHDGPTGGTACCASGASPYASQSKDAWRPNGAAGYLGSDLPPVSSGYDPDHLNSYQKPQPYNPSDYQQAPSPQPYNYNDPKNFSPTDLLRR